MILDKILLTILKEHQPVIQPCKNTGKYSSIMANFVSQPGTFSIISIGNNGIK